MAALSAARNTLAMGGEGAFTLTVPVKANQVIYQGALVAIDNATGYAVVPSVATTLISVGVAKTTVDSTGKSNGALSVDVVCEEGFLLDCSGQAQTALGRLMYFVDDHTVTVTSTGASIAGVCISFVSATQVWVYIGVPRTAGT